MWYVSYRLLFSDTTSLYLQNFCWWKSLNLWEVGYLNSTKTLTGIVHSSFYQDTLMLLFKSHNFNFPIHPKHAFYSSAFFLNEVWKHFKFDFNAYYKCYGKSKLNLLSKWVCGSKTRCSELNFYLNCRIWKDWGINNT